MSKRLQILIEEEELREVRRAAGLARVSVAEWVRAALRAAARHAFPAGEIGSMLAEIDAGFDAYPGLERISS